MKSVAQNKNLQHKPAQISSVDTWSFVCTGLLILQYRKTFLNRKDCLTRTTFLIWLNNEGMSNEIHGQLALPHLQYTTLPKCKYALQRTYLFSGQKRQYKEHNLNIARDVTDDMNTALSATVQYRQRKEIRSILSQRWSLKVAMQSLDNLLTICLYTVQKF